VAPPRFQVVISAAAAYDVTRHLSRLAPPPSVSWRLLGSNHRELGRSSDPFADVDQCLLAIRNLQDAVPDVDSQVLAHSSIGAWFWRIHIAGTAVAISSRLYQRRRESAQSLSRTLDGIQRVDREPVILRLRGGGLREGSRALKGPSPAAKIVELRDPEIRYPSKA